MMNFYTEQEYGYSAHIDDVGNLVISYHAPREGGVLWHGLYKGEKGTPYMDEIKKDNPKLYKRIVEYFERGPMETPYTAATVAQCSNFTSMEKLERIFKMQRHSIYQNHIELYHVLSEMFGG